TKAKWQAALKAEKDRIHPGAPDPLVLTADDIAAWVSHFKPLLRGLFPPELQEVHDLETWGRTITHLTPVFVAGAAWEELRERIARHADFTQPCHEVVLPLQGEAGVGKTRGAYEALCGLPGMNGLSLYTADEQLAVRIARQLANDPDARALLVVDECM